MSIQGIDVSKIDEEEKQVKPAKLTEDQEKAIAIARERMMKTKKAQMALAKRGK